MAQYPRQKVIAVDVDGTLHTNGKANDQVIAWIKGKRADGFKLILWSMRGEDHARKAAALFGIADLFDVITSKPGYIVDDKGWSWTRFTGVIRSIRGLNVTDICEENPSLIENDE